MVRMLKSVLADDIAPNTRLELFGVIYRVRKLNYHGDKVTLSLQDANEPISYFNKNDIITVTVPGELQIEVEVNP